MELKLVGGLDKKEIPKTRFTLPSKTVLQRRTSTKKPVVIHSNPKAKAIFDEIEEEKKPKDNNALYRKTVIVTLIIVIVLVSLLIFRPALIGYSVYKQAEDGNYSVTELGASVQNLRLQLATTKANLSLYQEVYTQVWDEVKSREQSLSDCTTTRDELTSQVAYVRQEWKSELNKCQSEKDKAVQDLTNQLSTKDTEIANALKQRDDMEKSFNNFVKNLAKSVCCKEKVDDPDINSYEVINDRLVCVNGGSNSLNC